MAAPSFIGSAPVVTGGGVLSVNFTSSGRVAGDRLYIGAMTANQTMATPSGFTLFVPDSGTPAQGTAGAAGGVKMTVFWKDSDGTETTVSLADSGDIQAAGGVVFRGSGGVAHDASIAGTGASATSTVMSGPTTGVDECAIINFLALDRDASGSTLSGVTNANTSPVERLDTGTSTNTGGGVGIFTGEKATAGAVGNTTVTQSAASAYAWITLAIKNASTATVITPTGGSAFVSGNQPTVARTAHKVVAPTGGSAVFAGNQPAVSQGDDRVVSPSAGSVLFAGHVPAIVFGRRVAPARGSMRIAGNAPRVGRGIGVIRGRLRWRGYRPMINDAGGAGSAATGGPRIVLRRTKGDGYEAAERSALRARKRGAGYRAPVGRDRNRRLLGGHIRAAISDGKIRPDRGWHRLGFAVRRQRRVDLCAPGEGRQARRDDDHDDDGDSDDADARAARSGNGLMPRFTSSILPPRPIVQRQAIAAAAVQSASAAAVVEEKVLEIAADPSTALGDVLQRYEERIYALENPLP